MRRRNLERRLVAAFLLVSGALALFSTGVQLWLDWRHDRAEVQAELRDLAMTYVDAVAEAVWVGDPVLLAASLRGIAGPPNVVGVTVHERGQSAVVEGSTAGADLTHTYRLTHLHRGARVNRGQLRVHASLAHAVERLQERLAVILATNLAKALLVALVMLWVFRRLVTRHLLRIADHAGAVELGGPAPPLLQLERGLGRPADELLLVATALNELQARVRGQLDGLAAADRQNRALNDKLDAHVKELERFGYSLSHDLRQSLRTVSLFTDILGDELQGRVDDETLDHVQRIRSATDRMNATVDAMLDLHRLSAQELAREVVDLTALVREVAEQVVANGDAAREVEWRIGDGLEIHADRGLLLVALENLLGNAFKYTEGRSPARIEVSAEPRPDGRLAVCVRDNGEGFDPVHAARIFEPFQRLHDARRFPGSGVGLATVERVVHRHGGEIWFDAAPGEGAAFYFTLEPPPT